MNQLGCAPKAHFVSVASCMGLMFVWGAVPYNVMADLEAGFGGALAPTVISFYPLFVTCCLLFFLIFAVFHRKLSHLFLRGPIPMLVSGILLSVLLASVYFRSVTRIQTPGIVILELVLSAACVCLLMNGWGVFVSHMPRRQAAPLMCISLLLFFLLTFVSSSFSTYTFFDLKTLVLPIISGIAYATAYRGVSAHGALQIEKAFVEQGLRGAWGKLPRRTIILLALLAFSASICMGFLSPADFEAFDLSTRLPICLIGIGFSILLIVFFRPRVTRQHINRAAWSMLVIVFLVTYATVVALGPSDSFLGTSFNVASRRIFILFYYIFFSELIYELTLPAFGIFSLANALFLAAPYTLRTIVSVLIGQGIISTDAKMMALFMMFIIACSFVLLFNGIQGFAADGEREGASEPQQAPLYSEAALATFASDIRLSAREREVLALLALNKSLQCVADTLGISINTLRSHTRSIYRKANVHSRQELLEKMGQESVSCEVYDDAVRLS